MANNDKDSVRWEEKLRGVENWARWSNMTMLDLKEKGYWGIVTGTHMIRTTSATVASFDWDSAGAAKIIKGGLNDNLFKNVEGTDNSTDIWNKLKAVCTQVGQGVVYTELHSLLLHPSTSKAQGHNKPINLHFAEITGLINQIQTAVTSEWDVWDDITLVTLLEGLSEEYNSKKDHILNQDGITLKNTQLILSSEEVWIKVDHEVSLVPNPTLAVWGMGWGQRPRDCYNCGELGHLVRDCPKPHTEKPHMNESTKWCSTVSYNNKWNPKHQVQRMGEYNSEDSDTEPSTSDRGQLNMIVSARSNSYNWYIDSEASEHITNQQHLFLNLEPYNKKFETVSENMISAVGKGVVEIHTKTETVQIKDVTLIPQATTNLISLKQLQQSSISYHDEGTKMTLKKKDRTVVSAQWISNLYILNIINNTAMAVWGWPSFLCAPTKELQLWHHWLAHSEIVWVKHASWITTGMDITAQDNNETLQSDDESDNNNSNEDKTQILHTTHHRQCVSLVSPANRPESFNMNQCDPPHTSLNEFTLIFEDRMIHHHLKTVHMRGYWLMILQESHGFCSCKQKINTLIRWRSGCNRQRMKLVLKWHTYMLMGEESL